jgi:hypothetical protein
VWAEAGESGALGSLYSGHGWEVSGLAAEPTDAAAATAATTAFSAKSDTDPQDLMVEHGRTCAASADENAAVEQEQRQKLRRDASDSSSTSKTRASSTASPIQHILLKNEPRRNHAVTLRVVRKAAAASPPATPASPTIPTGRESSVSAAAPPLVMEGAMAPEPRREASPQVAARPGPAAAAPSTARIGRLLAVVRGHRQRAAASASGVHASAGDDHAVNGGASAGPSNAME